MKLKDKVALITGGGGDIGSAIVTTFADEGAIVVVNGRSLLKAEAIVEKVVKSGGKGLAVQADVSRADEVNSMFDDIVNRFERIDILVNNVGITIGSPLVSHTDEDWDKVIRVNLYSIFYCSRAALSLMIKQKWGRIINMSSMLAFVGEPSGYGYAASKGAINSFTKSLAREAGRHGITVNAICPGLADTDMLHNYLELGGKYAKSLKRVWDYSCPIARNLEPQDVANLALYLASNEASFISGQLLRLDGGTL